MRATSDLIRYYDPLIGHFTQPDTIIPNPTNPQDFNRYSYVRNNPVNFNDPTGHCTNIVMWDSGDGFDCEFHMGDGTLIVDYDGNVSGRSTIMVNNDFRPPKPATDPALRAVPQYCTAHPGTSGLGFDAEIDAIERIEGLSPDGFWDLTSDPDEINRLGQGFFNWSNDGCSNSPDGMGGISFLGACGQHDFSYRNRKAWEEATGENIFSQQTRRDADDRLEAGLETVCDARCDWASGFYWVAVHGYGDGFGNPLPWDGLVPG